MKIILQFIHYPVCSGVMMYRALKRMGHDAYTQGWSTGHQIWGTVAPHAIMPVPPPDDFEPDLVIIADSDHHFFDRSHDIKGHPYPVVVYGVDNHVRDYHYMDPNRRHINRFFLAHKIPSVLPMDGADVEWLPCGYDPVLHAPSPIVWRQREYDAAIAGVIYQGRANAIRTCQSEGLKIRAGHAFGADYAAMYHNARVSLNWSSAADVPMRLYEAVSMRNIFVTDPLADLISIQNEPDYPREQIIEVRGGLSWLPEAVDTYSARRLTPSFWDRTWIDKQRWDDRMQVIIDWAQSE